MAKINAISNKPAELTIDPGASGDSFVQFDIAGTGEFRIGVDDDDSDKFKISAGSALGTTDVFTMTASGECNLPLQPAFSAYLSADDDNATGDATQVSPVICNTEIFDQSSDYNNATGYFTAPVTGRYLFIGSVQCHDLASAHDARWEYIVTSNRSYHLQYDNPYSYSSSGILANGGYVIADMDASDSANLLFVVFNGTKVVDINGGGDVVTRFGGYLIC